MPHSAKNLHGSCVQTGLSSPVGLLLSAGTYVGPRILASMSRSTSSITYSYSLLCSQVPIPERSYAVLQTFREERNVHIFRVRWSNESILLLLILTICARLTLCAVECYPTAAGIITYFACGRLLPSDLLPCCRSSFVLIRSF